MKVIIFLKKSFIGDNLTILVCLIPKTHEIVAKTAIELVEIQRIWWKNLSYCKLTTLTKTFLEPSMTELTPISKMTSFSTIQSFLMRYMAIFYVSWLRNGKSSKLEVKKKRLKSFSKTHIFQTFFNI